jgi:signal transduction histidine kinase
LDWHITTFINKDESLKAGYVIARRQFAFFILVLLAGIIFAVFISKKITHPLALLTQYARNLPDSDFKLKGYPLPVSIVSSSHNDEIKQLADSFAYLDQKVKDRTKELKRLNEHILYSEDIERRAVASDLHDSAAQTLAISISKIKTIQEPGKSISLESIAEIQGYLEQTVGDIRSMIYRLSPPILDDFGIDIALGFLIEESNKMHDTDIKYINLLDTPAHLKKSNKIAMYRTVSEIIMNIIKHSGSKNAKIELSNNKKFILLKAEDTGTGFDVNLFDEKKFSGFGLLTISEKIKNLGGSFKIVSKPGKGTKVFLSVPLGPTKK